MIQDIIIVLLSNNFYHIFAVLRQLCHSYSLYILMIACGLQFILIKSAHLLSFRRDYPIFWQKDMLFMPKIRAVLKTMTLHMSSRICVIH